MKRAVGALMLVVAWQVVVAVQTVSGGPGSIEGYVADADGGVLPGVNVQVSSATIQAGPSITTDARGRFILPQLPVGQYQLALTLPGFRTTRGSVGVKSGAMSSVTFQMAVGSLSEFVTVRALAPVPATVRAPQPVPAAATTPVRVGGSIREPRKIRDVKPVYPADAQAAGAEGDVVIEAVIGRDGAVTATRVLQGVPLLNTAALDAVVQWRYTPTLLNGAPIEVVATVTVRFVQ